MKAGMREYRRDLALYTLARAREPMTAAEVAEAMGTAAMSDGHPRECWLDIDAPSVTGVLRTLANAGQVEQAGESKPDRRNGRDAPTWRCALSVNAAKLVLMPVPPSRDDDAPGAPALPALPPSPYDGMTRKELYAVLEVSDLYTTACAQFMQQVADLNSRARRILANAGLSDGGDAG